MVNFTPTSAVIHEAQIRLRDLGHDTGQDPDGVLSTHTSIALQAFQRQRGLAITGALDAETWSRLVEAGWVLGSRLLFVCRPHLRGDDVAHLQEALALLGFDPGRIDGIFGPLTSHALEEFQRNCALETSGVLTRATLNELSRLSSRNPGRRPVTEARDSVGLRGDHEDRLVLIHGRSTFADVLAESLTSRVVVIRGNTESVHESAALANEAVARLVLATQEDPGTNGLTIHFYESYRSQSTIGRELAVAIEDAISRTSRIRVRVSGMSLPILRETLMPALVLVTGSDVETDFPLIARQISEHVAKVFDSSR